MVHTYNGCTIKKNEITLFIATWMDLEIIILSAVSQTTKDKHYMISFICGLLKKDKNELICRTETDSKTLKNLGLPEGTRVGEG